MIRFRRVMLFSLVYWWLRRRRKPKPEPPKPEPKYIPLDSGEPNRWYVNPD